MNLHGRSFIGGILVEESVATFRAISPLDNRPLDPEFHECALGAVAEALMRAEEAFPVYARITPNARAAFLERIAEEIARTGDALIDRAHRETGLSAERLVGERGRTVNQLRLFAGVVRDGSWCDARIDRAMPERQPLPRLDIRRMLAPLGPVIVFGASNFPLAFSVAGGDTASALAAGCPVIVKAHRGHPGTSEIVAAAIVRAVEASGLPGGVFSMLHGSGEQIGVALVRHPLARAAGFTGSRAGGRALFDAAASRPEPIPVFAEMSSLNPVFILPGAMRERGEQIALGLKGSVTMGAGQFCTKPGLVFGVGGPDLQAMTEALEKGIRETAPATMLHAGICNAYRSGIDSMAKVPGVVALAMSDAEALPDRTHGEAVLFTTDIDDFLLRPKLHEEVFGPCTLLVTAGSLSDLVRVAQRMEGQLTATIHATESDLADAADLIGILRRKAGRLVLNGYPTGVEVCPAMHHGGPYPATTDERFTSVGTAAIQRWARPVCFQNFPAALLPEELRDENPCGLVRMIDGKFTLASV